MKCNSCWADLGQQRAAATTCGHLFCKPPPKKHSFTPPALLKRGLAILCCLVWSAAWSPIVAGYYSFMIDPHQTGGYDAALPLQALIVREGSCQMALLERVVSVRHCSRRGEAWIHSYI